MLDIAFVIFLICVAAGASSRSRYWNAVLCRLWLILSVVWLIFAYWLETADGLNQPDWRVVVLPPIAFLLGFSVLHWAFSPRLPRDPMEHVHKAPDLPQRWPEES